MWFTYCIFFIDNVKKDKNKLRKIWKKGKKLKHKKIHMIR